MYVKYTKMRAHSAGNEAPSFCAASAGSVAEVLIVDDNPIDRLRAGRLIGKDLQYRVAYAENGATALARLADCQATIVVTDLRMEGMDGLELVRAIRSEHPQIPVIVMTGHGSEEMAMEALRVGATNYVPKQRLASELLAVVRRAMRTASASHRRRRCLESLVCRDSRFELNNDPELLPPLLEYLQDEMAQLDRWDSAELMRTTIALDEALRNALYHGNLEVSSELREESDRLYYEVARQRATQSPFRDRRIYVQIAHDPDHSRFVIRDEGHGFNTTVAHRPIEPEDLLRPSGRGLLLMKSFMDDVSFNEVGNEVTLLKRRSSDSLFTSSMPRKATAPAATALAEIAPLESGNAVESLPEENPVAQSPLADHPPRLFAPASGVNGKVTLEVEFYKRALDQMHDAVYVVDTQTRILYWNQAAERLTGHAPFEVLGKRSSEGPLDLLDASGRSLYQPCPITRSIEQDRTVNERLILRHKGGRLISVELHCKPVRDSSGTVAGAVLTLRDATTTAVVESAFRQVREAADRDGLTGLANRRSLDRTLGQYLGERERTGQSLSLIIADLDHFKQVNDTWGHAIGDQALAQFASLLQRQCRSIDFVARFGGEEFVVLLPGTSLETAVLIAERLRKSVRSATPEELGQRWLTASFGVAEATSEDTASQLLKRADVALYQAKLLGRDRVEVESSWKTRDEAGR
jgi:diguanylate cyclase (GGDEF)-like protein/PAS domain S-box-containing protein